MRRFRFVIPVLIGAFVFSSLPVMAQRGNAFSTKAIIEWQQALTDGSLFGVPRYTTALLPTCDSTQKGALAFDTTTGTLKVCDGSTWNAAGGSGLTVGTTTITSGTDTRVLFNDGGVLGEDAGFTYAKTTDILTVAEDVQAEVFALEDSDASHRLRILTTSNLGADRILTLVTGDAARTVTLSGDPTLSDWFDQSVKVAASPTFANVTDSGLTSGRVTFAGASGLLSDDADLTFATDTLTATKGVFGTSLQSTTLASFGGVSGATNTLDVTGTTLTWEGTDNTNEFQIAVSDPGLDITLTLNPQAASGGLRFDLSTGAFYVDDPVVIASNTTFFMNAGGFRAVTATTPDTVEWFTDTSSNSVAIVEGADINFDFNNGKCGTSACTNPSLIIHSPDQVTTEYVQIQTDTTGAGHIGTNVSEITLGGFKDNITEASAQVIARITLPTSGVYGALVTYTVSDSDGTDFVVRNGSIQVQGANKAGTTTCTINASQDQETEDGSSATVTGGALTLTYTWTNVVNTTSCDLSLNAASNAGANTYDIKYTVLLTSTAGTTVTPQ